MADQINALGDIATASLDALERGITTAGGVVWADVVKSVVGLILARIGADKIGSGIFQTIVTAIAVTVAAHFTMLWVKAQRRKEAMRVR